LILPRLFEIIACMPFLPSIDAGTTSVKVAVTSIGYFGVRTGCSRDDMLVFIGLEPKQLPAAGSVANLVVTRATTS
jgi:hypothetical protein